MDCIIYHLILITFSAQTFRTTSHHNMIILVMQVMYIDKPLRQEMNFLALNMNIRTAIHHMQINLFAWHKFFQDISVSWGNSLSRLQTNKRGGNKLTVQGLFRNRKQDTDFLGIA